MRANSVGAGRPAALRTNSRSSSMPLSGLAALRWQEAVIGVMSAKTNSGSTAIAERLCEFIEGRQSRSGMKTPRNGVRARQSKGKREK
jgi:Flp pilus assembly CpaE family ATPase